VIMSTEEIEIKEGSKIMLRRLECPFDLETILQISYSS